jgi:hypothetical protein
MARANAAAGVVPMMGTIAEAAVDMSRDVIVCGDSATRRLSPG